MTRERRKGLVFFHGYDLLVGFLLGALGGQAAAHGLGLVLWQGDLVKGFFDSVGP